MGLNFKNPPAPAVSAPQGQAEQEMEIVPFNIQADKQQLTERMANSKEVDQIVSTISVYELDTIVSFGSEVAENISKCSDSVLNSINMSQLDDSSEMLNTLAKIMEKFDIDEIQEKPGLLGKIFGNVRKQVDKILDKYHTMGTRSRQDLCPSSNSMKMRSNSRTRSWRRCLRRT